VAADFEAYSLASGSSGNCYLIKGGDTTILIDAGIALKALTAGLDHLGFSPAQLSGVFVTHEHSDHVKGVGPLSRRYETPVYANLPTIKVILKRCGAVNVSEMPIGQEMGIGPLSVRSYRLPHDGVCHVGYVVSCGNRSLCLATDIGFVCDPLKKEIGQADLLILEFNHDIRMLEEGPYPCYMKKRIRGSGGHISNKEASRVLVECCRGRRRQVWLAHLSRINNLPSLALMTAKANLERHGMDNIDLAVAARDVPSLHWNPNS
jgi:phosphoribosyl 1,2-cyclic phosphodiesterase